MINGKGGSIYFMTNLNKSVLYIGVTSNLQTRIWQHINKVNPNSFTARYNLTFCVYFEHFFSIEEAILREKQLKKWRREKKDHLVNTMNPEWKDLYEDIKEW